MPKQGIPSLSPSHDFTIYVTNELDIRLDSMSCGPKDITLETFFNYSKQKLY